MEALLWGSGETNPDTVMEGSLQVQRVHLEGSLLAANSHHKAFTLMYIGELFSAHSECPSFPAYGQLGYLGMQFPNQHPFL